MSGAFAAKTADAELEKGRVAKTKVKRYWAGRAPEYGDAAHGEHDQHAAADAAPRERARTEVAAPVIVRKADDPRLRRLMAQATLREEDGEDGEEAALRRRREVRAAEVVRRGGEQARHEEEEEEEEPGRRHPHGESEEDGAQAVPSGRGAEAQQEEDEEEVLRRRQAVRERLLQQQKEQERTAAAAAQEEDEEDEEEESEYETDSEDETAGRRLLKPVFVPKQARETIAEREALEKEEEEQEEKEKRRLLERKYETQQMVRERIAAEEAASREAAQGPLQVHDVDTDDDKDPVEAYESWKQRELARIRRDREEKEKQEAEIKERERLRSMTEEERAAWDRAHPKEVEVKEKKKLKFLQKYWHKGAYYQEAADDARGTAGTDDIFKRDYSAPTGEDKFDRASLPKVMQVKNFGRAGRTKYTHLVDQDTTFTAEGGSGGPGSDDPMIQALKEYAKKRNVGTRPEDFAKPKKFKA